MEFKEELKSVFANYNIDVTEKQCVLFEEYYKLIKEWNEKFNLTTILEQHDVIIKHFLDSFSLSKCADLKNKKICDVGSGAGFPSIPLKILDDSIEVWIIDSLNKRINFLTGLCEKLGINANLVHGRAEEFCLTKREYFDIVTARAVARLNILDELCMPLVKKDGYFLAMKSNEYTDELNEASKGIKILGGEIEDIFEYNLPYNDTLEYRNIIKIKKVNNTNIKYPREFAKIKKKPL